MAEKVAAGGGEGAISLDQLAYAKAGLPGLKQIVGWQSEITGEVFLNEKDAVSRDEELLKEYNGPEALKVLNEHVDKLQEALKRDMTKLAKIGDKAAYRDLSDLYVAIFDKKLERSNRYFGVNPFEVIWQLEARYSDFSKFSSVAEELANDIDLAKDKWKDEQQKGAK